MARYHRTLGRWWRKSNTIAGVRNSSTILICLLVFAGCSTKTETGTGTGTGTAKALAPAYYKPDPASVARISGGVSFGGKFAKPRPIDMDQDADCTKLYPGSARLDESMLVDRQGGLANAFIYIKTGLEGKSFETPSSPVRIDQRGCWFQPRVFGIQTGQMFEVSNSDPVTHNIHPVAKENRAWNQSQAPEAPVLRRTFLVPEVMVPVKCNVHNWMRAWVGVLHHPYFAVSGADGKFVIPNLPAGTYMIAVWHEKLGTQEQQVSVAPSAEAIVEFRFKGN